jgi:hypothetical protein
MNSEPHRTRWNAFSLSGCGPPPGGCRPPEVPVLPRGFKRRPTGGTPAPPSSRALASPSAGGPRCRRPKADGPRPRSPAPGPHNQPTTHPSSSPHPQPASSLLGARRLLVIPPPTRPEAIPAADRLPDPGKRHIRPPGSFDRFPRPGRVPPQQQRCARREPECSCRFTNPGGHGMCSRSVSDTTRRLDQRRRYKQSGWMLTELQRWG